MWKTADRDDRFKARPVRAPSEITTQAEGVSTGDPQKAIKFYVKAIKDLQEADQLYQDTLFYKKTGEELDYIGPNSVFRKTRFPINRLSLVLEKHKKYKESLSIVEKYEKMMDKRGLTKGDIESIRKRKDRIIKKLS